MVGKPSQFRGKVVSVEGYALGINYPIKSIVQAVSGQEIPVNVNLLAVGIADQPAVGSQVAIVGLNNDLVGQSGEAIKWRFRFKILVSQVPAEVVQGVPAAQTAFFLLGKEELPPDVPPPTTPGLSTPPPAPPPGFTPTPVPPPRFP